MYLVLKKSKFAFCGTAGTLFDAFDSFLLRPAQPSKNIIMFTPSRLKNRTHDTAVNLKLGAINKIGDTRKGIHSQAMLQDRTKIPLVQRSTFLDPTALKTSGAIAWTSLKTFFSLSILYIYIRPKCKIYICLNL